MRVGYEMQMVAAAASQPAAAAMTARVEEAVDGAGLEFTPRRDQAGYLADIEVRATAETLARPLKPMWRLPSYAGARLDIVARRWPTLLSPSLLASPAYTTQARIMRIVGCRHA